MLKKSKWIASALIMLPMLCLTVFPAVSAQAACPEDIFAQWKLDETGLTPGATGGVYADAIKDNDGTGNVNPTAATGRVGGSQLFTSALPNPTKINVPADNSFDWQADESFSIEFWMKTDSGIPTGNQAIIGRADGTPGLFWWVGVHSASGGKAAFTLRDTGNNGNNIPGGGTVNLADGGWHHVVAIRDTVQDKIILYVDGATDPTLEAADNTTAGFGSTRSLTLGWLNNGGGFHFDGLIDEVALYDRVLSGAEILAHYNAGLGTDICAGVAPFVPFPDDTISIWQLDETGLTPGATGGVYADAFDGNDGTGNVNPTAATGRVSGAQLFTSALPNPTKINVPADNSFDWQADESFSIEFWMKTDSGIPTGNQAIIGRADAVPGLFWWVGVHSASGGKAAFTLRDSGNNGNNIPGGGTVNLADGGWHHVVAIRDTFQDKIILYVDGATDPTLEAADNTTAGFGSTRSLTLGWLNNGGGFHFDGLIDEVVLYDRVLSGAEITAHRSAGLNSMGVESLRPEPLADAGTDQTVQEGATVNLNGANSDDAPGAIVSFLWEQVGTPAVALSGAATQTATFTAPDVAAGGTVVLTFQLTVTDNDGLTDTDTVIITVNDSSTPVTPAAGGGGGGGCFINAMF